MISYQAPSTTRQILIWISSYLLIHLAIRLLFSTTLQVDDAEQIRHAQYLSLGYPIPQPPFYSWLSWGMFQLLGTGLIALSILKYLLIGLTFWVLWLSTRYLYLHNQTRALALFSLLLMPSFAWHMHQGFTHTILLGLAITATLHALLRLKENSSPIDYLYFGTVIGIGLMAKYSFLLFVVPFLLAAFSIKEYRQKIFKTRIFITIAVITAITAPHILWLTQHYQEIFVSIDQKLLITQENLFLQRATSLWKFTISAIAFVTPWIIIFSIFSGSTLLTSHSNHKHPPSQLLSRFYLIIIITTLLLSLFFAMPHFKVRWFHPLMMLFPLWWLAHIETSQPPSRTLLSWTRNLTIIISILIILTRLIQVTLGPELGHYSRLNRPIIESLEQLPSFPHSTKLVTDDDFLGSHLLSKYPSNPIIIKNVYFRENSFYSSTMCLMLWDNDDIATPPELADTLDTGTISTDTGTITYTLYYASLPETGCP